MAFAWTVDSGGTLNTNFVAAFNLSSTADDKGGFTLTNGGSTPFNAGKNGNAADGGATNTTKSLYVGNNLGIDGGNISISCWVNVTTTPAATKWATWQGSDTTSKVKYAIGVTSAGNAFYLRGKEAVSNDSVTGGALSTATWKHLVLTYNGTTLEGWLNNVSQGTIAASGTGSGAGEGTGFAILDSSPTGGGTEYLSGLVDAAYVWTKKLSNTEVADLYNSGTGSFYNQTAVVNSRFLVFM